MAGKMSICPGCQIGVLEPHGGKTICNNTRCHYTETCSDGGCMVGSDIIENKEGMFCVKCFNPIDPHVIEHNCPVSGSPLVNEPSSTAESDYARNNPLIAKPPDEGTELTTCKYCNQDSAWHFAPQGEEWLCLKCNRVNPRIDSIKMTLEHSVHMVSHPEFKPVAIQIVPITRVKKTKIYLSGPMTGLPKMNSEVFKQFAIKYESQGFDVVNPATNLDMTIPYEDHMRRDVRMLVEDGIERVYLLPNWQYSKGANLEVHLAKTFKIPLYDAETGEPYKETIVDEAKRLVHGDRRDTYKNPLDDFGRTAGIINAVFHHKLKQDITAQDIALMMIAVKLSRLTNKPDHRDSCVDIAGYAECYWWCGELIAERAMQSETVSETT